jgi:hypothetical protein
LLCHHPRLLGEGSWASYGARPRVLAEPLEIAVR